MLVSSVFTGCKSKFWNYLSNNSKFTLSFDIPFGDTSGDDLPVPALLSAKIISVI